MDRERFVKLRFKAYQEIDYKDSRMEIPCRCMIVAINFDNETFTLSAVDIDYYTQDGFDAPIQYCELPKFELKIKT